MVLHVDEAKPSRDVVALIEALEMREYNERKYRTRGDARALDPLLVSFSSVSVRRAS